MNWRKKGLVFAKINHGKYTRIRVCEIVVLQTACMHVCWDNGTKYRISSISIVFTE